MAKEEHRVAQIEVAKQRCRCVIDSIHKLPSSSNITHSCRRTLLKLARAELDFLSQPSSSTTLRYRSLLSFLNFIIVMLLLINNCQTLKLICILNHVLIHGYWVLKLWKSVTNNQFILILETLFLLSSLSLKNEKWTKKSVMVGQIAANIIRTKHNYSKYTCLSKRCWEWNLNKLLFFCDPRLTALVKANKYED